MLSAQDIKNIKGKYLTPKYIIYFLVVAIIILLSYQLFKVIKYSEVDSQTPATVYLDAVELDRKRSDITEIVPVTVKPKSTSTATSSNEINSTTNSQINLNNNNKANRLNHIDHHHDEDVSSKTTPDAPEGTFGFKNTTVVSKTAMDNPPVLNTIKGIVFMSDTHNGIIKLVSEGVGFSAFVNQDTVFVVDNTNFRFEDLKSRDIVTIEGMISPGSHQIKAQKITLVGAKKLVSAGN